MEEEIRNAVDEGVISESDLQKVNRLKTILDAGKTLGFVYKFDAITLLKKLSSEAKLKGSNGKAKGLSMAADAVSRLRSADAVRVTRCEKCSMWKRDSDDEECKTGLCQKFACKFPADGFCSEATGKKIGNKEDNERLNKIITEITGLKKEEVLKKLNRKNPVIPMLNKGFDEIFVCEYIFDRR